MKKISLLLCLSLATIVSFSQNKWTKKKSHTGHSRYSAISFSVNGHGYYGGGYDTYSHKDFWDYDPTNDTWTQVADITGARHSAVSFVIGSYAYVGAGLFQNQFSSPLSTFYKYDAANNIWSSVQALSQGVISAVGFSSGGKGYVYGGYDGSAGINDLWEYDPSQDSWTKKADFPGAMRTTSVAFNIGKNSYVGSGFDGTTRYNDFYCYNSDSDTWHQVASYPAGGFFQGSTFTIGNYGYVCGGYDGNDMTALYQYNPMSNKWTKLKDYAGAAFRAGIGFSIGNNGYVGLGAYGSAPNFNEDLYMYEQPNASAIEETPNQVGISVFPNPSSNMYNITISNATSTNHEISIVNNAGQILFTKSIKETTSQIDLSNYSAGIYYIQVKDKATLLAQTKIVKE